MAELHFELAECEHRNQNVNLHLAAIKATLMVWHEEKQSSGASNKTVAR